MPKVLRFISYVYAYTGNSKESNKGFIKVETVGPACKIEIHLKGISDVSKENTIYLFVQKENFIQKVEIGRAAVENGMLNFIYRGKKDDIEESGFAIQEMEGVYLPLEEHKYCLSLWKENEFREEQLLGEPLEEKSEEVLVQEIKFTDHEEREKKTADYEHGEIKAESEDHENLETNSKMEIIEEKEEQTREGQKENQPKTPDLKATETTARQPQSIHYYQRLKTRLPIFFPIEGEPIECLKMELPDLRELPRTCWYFTNNSFLLHGFFNYKYFILAMDPTGETVHYFLGIPGIFSNQERVMATLFGFPDFQAVKKSSDLTGQFGFWYRMIE